MSQERPKKPARGRRSGPESTRRSSSSRKPPTGTRRGHAGGDRRRPARDGTSDDTPRTAAQRKRAEVDARRSGPRRQLDPDAERRRIEERTTESWVDEGSVRGAAISATSRARTPTRPSAPHRVDAGVEAQLVDALGTQRGRRLAERLAQASEALDRERFDEARRISSGIVKEAPDIASAHEVLGLASYRLGRYKQAVKALATARDLHPDPALLPVIADSYRALKRYSAVERTWRELKAASPAQPVMTEGRIVAAGALADQGDVRAAIALLEDAQTKKPKRVRDHHLREWYVLGDLYDRLGDPIAARRWFEAIAQRDRGFVDVDDRLRGLGR